MYFPPCVCLPLTSPMCSVGLGSIFLTRGRLLGCWPSTGEGAVFCPTSDSWVPKSDPHMYCVVCPQSGMPGVESREFSKRRKESLLKGPHTYSTGNIPETKNENELQGCTHTQKLPNTEWKIKNDCLIVIALQSSASVIKRNVTSWSDSISV